MPIDDVALLAAQDVAVSLPGVRRLHARCAGPIVLFGVRQSSRRLAGCDSWQVLLLLSVGRAEQKAVFEDGQFRPRLVMPLSLSYDHRLIDGADAARFLRWTAEALEQPLLLLLED